MNNRKMSNRLSEVFLWVWVFVFGCAILPVGLGLIWLTSGILLEVFKLIDKVVSDIFNLRFTHQFLFYGVSVVFGVCFSIYQWKKRNKG